MMVLKTFRDLRGDGEKGLGTFSCVDEHTDLLAAWLNHPRENHIVMTIQPLNF